MNNQTITLEDGRELPYQEYDRKLAELVGLVEYFGLSQTLQTLSDMTWAREKRTS